jgi:hypothetical protein
MLYVYRADFILFSTAYMQGTERLVHSAISCGTEYLQTTCKRFFTLFLQQNPAFPPDSPKICFQQEVDSNVKLICVFSEYAETIIL